jgi:starch synthase
MPSHFEPCGMGQMIAMRYGALPLVRETGGLADTVTNYDNADADVGTGFVFLWEEVEAVLNTMRWALDTYRNKQDAWRRMQQRAMRIDFSWDKSARQYEVVYQRALAKHKGK